MTLRWVVLSNGVMLIGKICADVPGRLEDPAHVAYLSVPTQTRLGGLGYIAVPVLQRLLISWVDIETGHIAASSEFSIDDSDGSSASELARLYKNLLESAPKPVRVEM